MNYRLIGKILSFILFIEIGLLVPPLLISAVSGDTNVTFSFLKTIALLAAAGGLLYILTRKSTPRMYAKEALVTTGLSWIIMSFFGCLPFVFSGVIPHLADAFFEVASGFTTTGASILSSVEDLPRALLFWHSFSHWIGGMGVLVFLMAILPLSNTGNGYTLRILRAESPGPVVGKLTPKMSSTAQILYLIYFGLTMLDAVLLKCGGLSWFDAFCLAFGTAATGGFGVVNDSFMSYSPYIINVTTVFMFIFSINFSLYYLLLMKQFKAFFKDEEKRLFLIIVGASIALITWNILGMYSSWNEALRHAAFQVATVTSTSGFASADFDQWPALSKTILLCLMCMGACAGSTGGGFKVSRILLLMRNAKRNIKQYQHPQGVEVIKMNGQRIDEQTIASTNVYLSVYVAIAIVSPLVISLDGFSTETNISAVIACLNNIGPGFAAVGPTANYAGYSVLSKIVLSFDMLLGRLEILPILVLFVPRTWKKHS